MIACMGWRAHRPPQRNRPNNRPAPEERSVYRIVGSFPLPVPEGRPKIARRFNGGKRRPHRVPAPEGRQIIDERFLASHWKTRTDSFVPDGTCSLSRPTPTVKTVGYSLSSLRDAEAQILATLDSESAIPPTFSRQGAPLSQTALPQPIVHGRAGVCAQSLLNPPCSWFHPPPHSWFRRSATPEPAWSGLSDSPSNGPPRSRP